MEEINWNKTGPNIRRKFIIPVGNLSKEDAKNSLKYLMKSYKEEIIFDDNITKDYFLPVKENLVDIELNKQITEELEKCKDIIYYIKNYVMTKYDKSDIRAWLPYADNIFVQDLLKDWGKEDVYGPWTKPYKEGDKMTFYKSFYLIDYDDTAPNLECIEDKSYEQDLEYFKYKLEKSLEMSYIPKSRYDKSNLAKQDNKFTKLFKCLKFW